MDIMGVAKMSMAMSQGKVEQQASLSVAKKVMNQQEAQMTELLEMLPTPNSFGHQLDVYV